MIEAVGEKFWATYFSALDTLLAPAAAWAAVDHHAARPDDGHRRSYTWIHKYVFPGGIIPSIRSIEDNLAAHNHPVGRRAPDLGPH